MKIWILNHHAIAPNMGGGTRHYDFAKELIKRGHTVTIFASSFHYAKYREMKEYTNTNSLQENIAGVKFVWMKTPPYFSNGIARVKSMLAYTFNVLRFDKTNEEKPDIIIGSSVHLFAVYAAYKLARKYRTPFIFEVRDLWPQTLIDMGMSKLHPFVLLQACMEKFLYKKADHIITLLPKADRYIENLGVPSNKITWISNGTVVKERRLKSKVLPEGKFNVLYAGSMGEANNLKLLISASILLKSETDIHFTLIGEGVEKEQLQKLASDNVTFLDAVPKEDIFAYLQSADLLYVGLQNLPLYRFGMSMNKVFDYMSVKKPILFVSDIEENIVEIAKAGVVIKSNNADEIRASIFDLSKTDKNTLSLYGENGYNYLLENFSITILCDALERILIRAVKRK